MAVRGKVPGVVCGAFGGRDFCGVGGCRPKMSVALERFEGPGFRWARLSVLRSGGLGAPPGFGARETERDETLQVDGGGSVRDPEFVAFDPSVADFPVWSSHEPRDGALDHGSVLPVDVLELDGRRCLAGSFQE